MVKYSSESVLVILLNNIKELEYEYARNRKRQCFLFLNIKFRVIHWTIFSLK